MGLDVAAFVRRLRAHFESTLEGAAGADPAGFPFLELERSG
jgi:hypothetical protein